VPKADWGNLGRRLANSFRIERFGPQSGAIGDWLWTNQAARAARVSVIACAAHSPVSTPPSMKPWLSNAQCSPAEV
jgi:hypothetical protein